MGRGARTTASASAQVRLTADEARNALGGRRGSGTPAWATAREPDGFQWEDTAVNERIITSLEGRKLYKPPAVGDTIYFPVAELLKTYREDPSHPLRDIIGYRKLEQVLSTEPAKSRWADVISVQTRKFERRDGQVQDACAPDGLLAVTDRLLDSRPFLLRPDDCELHVHRAKPVRFGRLTQRG